MKLFALPWWVVHVPFRGYFILYIFYIKNKFYTDKTYTCIQPTSRRSLSHAFRVLWLTLLMSPTPLVYLVYRFAIHVPVAIPSRLLTNLKRSSAVLLTAVVIRWVYLMVALYSIQIAESWLQLWDKIFQIGRLQLLPTREVVTDEVIFDLWCFSSVERTSELSLEVSIWNSNGTSLTSRPFWYNFLAMINLGKCYHNSFFRLVYNILYILCVWEHIVPHVPFKLLVVFDRTCKSCAESCVSEKLWHEVPQDRNQWKVYLFQKVIALSTSRLLISLSRLVQLSRGLLARTVRRSSKDECPLM